jgi:hypothetical protein
MHGIEHQSVLTNIVPKVASIELPAKCHLAATTALNKTMAASGIHIGRINVTQNKTSKHSKTSTKRTFFASSRTFRKTLDKDTTETITDAVFHGLHASHTSLPSVSSLSIISSNFFEKNHPVMSEKQRDGMTTEQNKRDIPFAKESNLASSAYRADVLPLY